VYLAQCPAPPRVRHPFIRSPGTNTRRYDAVVIGLAMVEVTRSPPDTSRTAYICS